MAWADRLGAAELLQRLRFLEQRHGALEAGVPGRAPGRRGGAFADLQEAR